jgi:hypothetical protein
LSRAITYQMAVDMSLEEALEKNIEDFKNVKLLNIA